MKHLNWFGACAILVLSGCQIPDYTGSGPLILNTSQQNHFDQYRNSDTTSKYFMITVDRRGTFNFYCEDITGCQMSPGQAINLCEIRHGKPCKLYADGNDVVWRFKDPSDTATATVNVRAKGGGISDLGICKMAIQADRPHWDNRGSFMGYVYRAKRRGITEQRCARLTGRFTEQQIRKAASVISPPKNDTKADTNSDVEQQLKQVKNLLEKGLITSKEAEQKRREILERL